MPIFVVILGITSVGVLAFIYKAETGSFLVFAFIAFTGAVLVPAGLLQMGLILSLGEQAGLIDQFLPVILYQQLAVLGYIGMATLEEDTEVLGSIPWAQDLGWSVGLVIAVLLFSRVRNIAPGKAFRSWMFLLAYHLLLMIVDRYWGMSLAAGFVA